MNFNKICVYDFETDSADPMTCNPVQLAAVMVNPRTLEIIEGSEFNSGMQPLDFDPAEGSEYRAKHQDTIDWHARVSDCTSDDILKRWQEAPHQKDVFLSFAAYLERYHTRAQRKNKFSAPLKAGYNISKFDNTIMNRLCADYDRVEKNGEMNIFHPRDQIDGLHLAFFWFENMEEPKSYNMDTLRDYLGMSGENAHDALQDVKDTAKLIIRFMKLHRRSGERVTFKGAFK